MLEFGIHANGNRGAVSDDSLRFLKSLKELKELRAQIHTAADYCEKSYKNSEDKAIVLENTKEYLCRAVVTVVDHLGSVSASLDGCIQKSDRANETERRINCLKQKLDSCDQYNHNFTLTKIRWTKDLPRYYTRYISTPSDSSKELRSDLREPNQPTNIKGVLSEPEFKTIEEMPLFMYTIFNKIRLGTSPRSPLDIAPKEITVMPVCEGFSVAPKLIRNPSFHFQDNRKPGGIRRLLLSIQRKSVNDEEVISVPRRSKRGASRLLRLKL
ncbi:protein ABIL3-like [Chenopodium quinoa]|uniref:protein ABIL3-like n=1 Tax=Chenopodium quinoa TaxID=63459 RepID=UPI000B7936AA|nr:protein ABIL3-like [Chenopodium quinoa]